MKILMLGDVNGGPGRRMLTEHVKRLKAELGLAAGGYPRVLREVSGSNYGGFLGRSQAY